MLPVTGRMCATKIRKEVKPEESCCMIDEGWPLGVALQGEASNRPEAALVKSQGGERSGKRFRKTKSGEGQGDERK